MSEVLDIARARQPEMVQDVLALVSCESPSGDASALRFSAEEVSRVGTRLLGDPPEVLVTDGVPHLRWRVGSGPGRVLLLGHHDTVWPVGTLTRIPATCKDGVIRGPGCFDMKAGLVMAMHAVTLAGREVPVTLLVTGDEETGSATSRDLIEATAQECSSVLVLEAAAEGGALKTARKGVSQYQVQITGRAAHAGLEPEKGLNATVEAAHQILQIAALSDEAAGTTVTPSVVRAGTTANTVPAEALFSVDVRAWTSAEQRRVDEEMRALGPRGAGLEVRVSALAERPPLEEARSTDLFERASVVAARLGLRRLERAAVGGGSDGNITAGLGLPTLDGLGAVGGGAHADNEHVLTWSLSERAALVGGLIDDLTRH